MLYGGIGRAVTLEMDDGTGDGAVNCGGSGEYAAIDSEDTLETSRGSRAGTEIEEEEGDEIGDDEDDEKEGQDGDAARTGYSSDSSKLRSSEWCDDRNDIESESESGLDILRNGGGLSGMGTSLGC